MPAHEGQGESDESQSRDRQARSHSDRIEPYAPQPGGDGGHDSGDRGTHGDGGDALAGIAHPLDTVEDDGLHQSEEKSDRQKKPHDRDGE